MREIKRNLRIVSAASLLLFPSCIAVAQCSALTGFPRLACEAANRAHNTKPQSPAPAADKGFSLPLSTSLGDVTLADTLPPSDSPKGFKSLFTLSRVDDGAFILRSGFYEARVESYYFENANNNIAHTGAYFPAPIRGSRAAVIGTVLKQAELHPEIKQGAVQDLLSAIVKGMDLENMPMNVQQTALVVLPKDVAKQLQAGARTKTAGRNVMDFLNNRTSPQPADPQKPADNETPAAQVPAAAGSDDDDAPLPAVRGTWAQLTGGFYVRYLPDDCWHTRIQLMVPDAALKTINPASPLTFDPTQYLAILGQEPGQRLGITLRH